MICPLLELGKGTLDALFEQSYLQSPIADTMRKHSTPIKQILMRYTNIALYLCAQNAEVVPKTAKPAALKPNPKHKLYNTPTPTVWGVGERIGAILRASSSAAQTKSQGGNGAAKRPHVRRAHSHAYRVGPGRVNTIIKWLHPMLINIEDPTDLPTTIRPVK